MKEAMKPTSFDIETMTRLAVRACRVALYRLPGYPDVMEDTARRIQEVWEEEMGIDLSGLATWSCDAYDADVYMRRIYRKRKGLPVEIMCDYCGAHVEEAKAADSKYCNSDCSQRSVEFRRRKTNG